MLRNTLVLLVLCSFHSIAQASECVVLLHGLARTSSSMDKLATALLEEGFQVANVSYPSTEYYIEKLSNLAVEKGLSECPTESTIHFVAHSLGGILIRYYLENGEIARLGRVVMLAPPNQGSEVVDKLHNVPGFELIFGHAGEQLGTDEASIPSRLGPVDFELGVIAGTKSVNPVSSPFLPNPDDGTVSVERTKVEGMNDFITVPHSHPFIMKAETTIEQTISFLMTGSFKHEDPEIE
jgi:pimeloyl-ACP methyl ester carboxylesterase